MKAWLVFIILNFLGQGLVFLVDGMVSDMVGMVCVLFSGVLLERLLKSR